MENYYWPLILQNVSSKLNPNHKSKSIAVSDIGYAVASAFDDPATFAGKAIDLAGDALTPRQIVAAFKDVTGIDLDAQTPQEFPPDFKKAYDVSDVFLAFIITVSNMEDSSGMNTSLWLIL